MLFTSLHFGAFFLLVYVLYLILPHKWQNRLLLVASYLFYASWDWRFVLCLLFSTFVGFCTSHMTFRSRSLGSRRTWLVISIVAHLSLLGFFKYYGFFTGNLAALLGGLGLQVDVPTLYIILPVGISFYIFQTLGYCIDIYRGTTSPTRNVVDFALFIAFFPKLLAGPIERASSLLSQISRPRKVSWETVRKGCYLVYWGLFQKIVVADSLAPIADGLFNGSLQAEGISVLLGTYAFAFQLYCDFAGYSNIAIGLAMCMGFHLTKNFDLPYFADNPQEFWRRWHISLSSWFRDYVYVPLGGNRKGLLQGGRNVVATMVLGGLWHGAAWTFVIWGAYHSVLVILYRSLKYITDFLSLHLSCGVSWRRITGQLPWKALRTLIFFHFICLGWLIFKAESIEQACELLSFLVHNLAMSDSSLLKATVFQILGYLSLLAIIEWQMYWKKDIWVMMKWPVFVRLFVYVLMLVGIIISWTDVSGSGTRGFIYFQF